MDDVELCGAEVTFPPARCNLPVGHLHDGIGHATSQIPEPLSGVAASMVMATDAAERERVEYHRERVRNARITFVLCLAVVTIGVANLLSLLQRLLGW